MGRKKKEARSPGSRSRSRSRYASCPDPAAVSAVDGGQQVAVGCEYRRFVQAVTVDRAGRREERGHAVLAHEPVSTVTSHSMCMDVYVRARPVARSEARFPVVAGEGAAGRSAAWTASATRGFPEQRRNFR